MEHPLAEFEVDTPLVAEADRACPDFAWRRGAPAGRSASCRGAVVEPGAKLGRGIASPADPGRALEARAAGSGPSEVGERVGMLAPLRAPQAFAPGHRGFLLDMFGGKFGHETARDRTRPLAVDPAVGGMDDECLGAGASDRDIGQSAFLLEAGIAALVERPLRGEYAFFPADQEDHRELEPLGGVNGHDGDLGLAPCRVVVHHEADMFEERAERFIFLHRPGKFGEVLKPARGFGAALGLEHRGVARFLEH